MKKNTIVSLLTVTFLISSCASMQSQEVQLDPIEEAALALRSGRKPGSLEDPDQIRTRASSIQRAIQTGDIAIGMSMEEVRSSWGDPVDVAIAGDPNHGNQRWTYREVASRYFGGQSDRSVYFEDGKVAGWKTRKR